MKDEQKIRKEYKYSTSGVFKKKGSLWSPLWTWIPVPIVPIFNMIFFIPRVLSKQLDLIFKKTYIVWHSLQLLQRRQNSAEAILIDMIIFLIDFQKIVKKIIKIATKSHFYYQNSTLKTCLGSVFHSGSI